MTKEEKDGVEEEVSEEPNIWEQKWTFLALVIAYVVQAMVAWMPGALQTIMAYEVHHCKEEELRLVDSYLKWSGWPINLKIICGRK